LEEIDDKRSTKGNLVAGQHSSSDEEIIKEQKPAEAPMGDIESSQGRVVNPTKKLMVYMKKEG
jgi:hypothetical protein